MKDNFGTKYAENGSQPYVTIEKSNGPTDKSDKEKTKDRKSWIDQAMDKFRKLPKENEIPSAKAPKNPYDTILPGCPGKLNIINEIGKKRPKEDGPRHMKFSTEKDSNLETSDVQTAESKATQVDYTTKLGSSASKNNVNQRYKNVKKPLDVSYARSGSNLRSIVKENARNAAKRGIHPAFQDAGGFMGQGIDVADMFPKPVKTETQESKATQVNPSTKAGGWADKSTANKLNVHYKKNPVISYNTKYADKRAAGVDSVNTERAGTKYHARNQAFRNTHPAFKKNPAFQSADVPKPTNVSGQGKTWQTGVNAPGHPKTGTETPESIRKTTFETIKNQNKK
jgi:hypothetical protein